ncbi:methylenetetrahydrofolate reductase [Anaerotalea alkaliphila]|uniref:Methylenetetrahydrofolate reductase n=1 Tax=Anaerotalea alkaliphila TaxID=2662126 RepID=A0A7X5KNA1_9FIRM|nr:methylenetetrahydrofolate reductase [Anaerotalea alkaliphila]NDL66572.1 5,10-methylenetetrahydrofolate reductase [Anaerotalea alkaliphila]
MLKHKLETKAFGILTYGITPPKSSNPEEKIREITARHIGRIRNLDIDGLILYDIQDESDRTHEKRTFDFIRTVDPSVYSREYLKELKVPRIVYRCVGNYEPQELGEWLEEGKDEVAVFVGAASRNQVVKMRLQEAYAIHREKGDKVLLGGVTIPERHLKKKDEPERIGFKYQEGCRFFVSQAVYNVEGAKAFLKDYAAYCKKHGIEMVPILFTLTPCGSERTLQFIKWLGISVPAHLEEALLQSGDHMLQKSMELSLGIFKELTKFALEHQIPIGCNVESVSIRKEEIEASIRLTREIKAFIEEVRAERL